MKEPLLMFIGKKQSDHSYWVTGRRIGKGIGPLSGQVSLGEGPCVLPRLRVCWDGCSFPHWKFFKEVLRESSQYKLC